MKRIALLALAGVGFLNLAGCTEQQQANFGRGMQAAAFGFAYGAANRPVFVAPVYQAPMSIETTCTQMGGFTSCTTW